MNGLIEKKISKEALTQENFIKVCKAIAKSTTYACFNLYTGFFLCEVKTKKDANKIAKLFYAISKQEAIIADKFEMKPTYDELKQKFNIIIGKKIGYKIILEINPNLQPK